MPQEPAGRPGVGAGRRVMVVDDDEDIRSVLSDALEDAGYEIRCAVSGRDALVQLGAGYRPQLILLDLMMPDLDGWHFRQGQLQHPEIADIPIIAMSAGSPSKQLPEGVVFLRKPFDLETMFAEVGRLIGGARGETVDRDPSVP